MYGILFVFNQKKKKSYICDMSGLRDYAKLKIPDTERQILEELTHIWTLGV